MSALARAYCDSMRQDIGGLSHAEMLEEIRRLEARTARLETLLAGMSADVAMLCARRARRTEIITALEEEEWLRSPR